MRFCIFDYDKNCKERSSVLDSKKDSLVNCTLNVPAVSCLEFTQRSSRLKNFGIELYFQMITVQAKIPAVPSGLMRNCQAGSSGQTTGSRSSEMIIFMLSLLFL